MEDLRKAIQRADPRLSRFDPLPRILFFDTFDRGMSGWNILMGNYTESLDRRLPEYRRFTSPMLSNATHWDGGTHGALDGSYSLKLATRPERGAVTVSLKRLTFPVACLIQLECWFAFKPEATEAELSDRDVRSVGVVFDLQGKEHRVLPHLRYLNALDGQPRNVWQYKEESPGFHDVGDETVSIFHYGEGGWQDVPGGNQRLCYNEIPTKLNWHYLKIGFDIRTMRFAYARCNDCEMAIAGHSGISVPAMPNLWNLLNVIPFVATDSDKRAFFYLDSVLLSGDWE